MNSSVIACLFLFGVAFGSFLNVVSMRYEPSGRLFSRASIGGRSHCPSCGKVLAWYELIPVVSFLIQRGRCRSCAARLSIQYPFVEILVGLIFVFVPLTIKNIFFPFTIPWAPVPFIVASALWVAVFMALVLVFLIDAKHYLIPNGLNLFIFLAGIAWVALAVSWRLFSGIAGGSFLGNYGMLIPSLANPWWAHGLGLVAGAGFFFVLVVLTLGKAMGMGDVKLMAGLGLLMGWPDILPVMLLSFVIGALFSVWLMIRSRKKMSDMVPFGPFIVIAFALVFFFGAGLMGAYFGILSW
jgi:prepilin signal peptidase PulO-like enzyme (type II secretory pathway)